MKRPISLNCLVFLILVIWLAPRLPAETNTEFQVGSLKVRPGETVSGYLDVPAKAGEGTVIPVTVINGLNKGPVLACVAGIHGYEYPPILALYELKKTVDPKMLSGTLLLVHIANVPSFARRTVYYTPSDWKNLNRVFPGDADGTLSQRIAYVLNRDVIGRCDDLLDLHGGDGNEALMPYTYWMVGPDQKLNAVSRDLALAFGLRHIIIDETRTRSLSDSKYLGNTAILRGKPAITTETGALGRSDEEYVKMALTGIRRVMQYLGMTAGKPEMVDDPVWIDKYEVLYSGATGLFTPTVKMSDRVVQGQKVGFVTDYLGRLQEEVRAPFDGVVLYVLGTPPISQGEPMIEVGRLKK
jgi:predicted deacylase